MGIEANKEINTDYARKPESGGFRESLERQQGPLVDIVKAYPDDDLKRIDNEILNQSGLTSESLSWVKDPEQAKAIAGSIRAYLGYPEGMISDPSKRAETESAKKKAKNEIARLLDEAFDAG